MIKSTNPQLAIIIPTYNRKAVTLGCIDKLNSGTVTYFKIFICDSESTDGTQATVQNRDHVELLNVGALAWWSAAVNKGVQKALNENFHQILILNDDIEFSSNLISQLIAKSNLHPLQIISPAQKSASGIYVGTKYVGLFKKHLNIFSPPQNSDIHVHSTNGCCLLIPSVAFQNAGLFNEQQCPHLFGDVEFQIRAAEAGIPTIACPDIQITQLGNTDYYRRLTFQNLFTFPGSPLHFTSHFAFGKALYKNRILFMILGWRYQLTYLKSFMKIMLHLTKKLFS